MTRQLTSLGSRIRGVVQPTPSIPFVKNGLQKVEIPNVLLSRTLALRLTGNLVVGVANAANIFTEAPLGLIRSISVICDGTTKVIISGGSQLLWRLSHFERRQALERSAPSATVGTRAFSATIMLDHEFFRATDPSETLFDPRRFKKVELAIQWGAETDIATAGGGGGTIAIDTANTSIDVLATQVGVGAGKILFDRVIAADQIAVTATQSKLDLKIPQAGLLTGILLRATRDAGAGAGPVPVDDVINTVILLSDTSTKHMEETKWSTIQQKNNADYAMQGAVAGYAFIELMENGDFASCLNVNAVNDTRLRFNVTLGAGTQLIDVLYVFAEPRPQTIQKLRAVA